MISVLSKIACVAILVSTTVYGQKTVLERTEIEREYKENMLATDIDGIDWNGSVEECNPGTLSQDILNKALKRINYFRRMCGLGEVVLDEELTKWAQAATLMMTANGKLSHNPEENWSCYSSDGAKGANRSCLGLSDWTYFKHNAFVTGFIRDFGASNYYVGHRKWILHSQLSKVGYGATPGAESVLTVDGVDWQNKSDAEYIAYPWKGYVPYDLIFPKWSFTIPVQHEVDFTNTSIQMRREDGRAIQVEKQKLYPKYLDHTVVWVAKGLFTDDEIAYAKNGLKDKDVLDKKIQVSLKNVIVDGERKDYSYWVMPIEVSVQ